jgi:hypothetical protein
MPQGIPTLHNNKIKLRKTATGFPALHKQDFAQPGL